MRYYGRKGVKGVNWEIIISESEAGKWRRNDYALVMRNTRWVLDNLEYLPTYRVVSDKTYQSLLQKKDEYYDKRNKKVYKGEAVN